jgi:hypothetical protein
MARAIAAAALALTVAGPAAVPMVTAAGAGPTMDAAVMLEGHARVGSWMAVQVRIRNEGAAMTGELRMAGGAQTGNRFGTVVDLPPGSDKIYWLYAQPPSFGGTVQVALVQGERTVATVPVAFSVHDAAQLVVGVVAEQPEAIVRDLDLVPSPEGQPPAVVRLGIEDLPERVEAWAPLDRIVWQDADSSQLSAPQIEALRGWIGSGGRLVIAGGTSGGASLGGFPDDLLPYRPSATVNVPATSLATLLGGAPADAPDVPALSGDLARGRALVEVGGRVVAAEAPHGGGGVTLLGFDPARGWVGDVDGVTSLWRRVLPARLPGPVVTGDDSQVVGAVTRLPALALPPISGLLALLAAYIVLIGPINYLVLRRLDRREWAWVTMPVLIVVFAAGAYGFGAALRGVDVIVNEVAVVRGALDSTQGTAQAYLGVFSPTRGTYQLEVPGGALLSPTLSSEVTGRGHRPLDVLQGEPSRVRDLTVDFGSLRTVRAETPASVPRVQADLRLEGGALVGTIRNASDQTLEKAAVVLGASTLQLGAVAPGAEQTVRLPLRGNPFGQGLADRLLGTSFVANPERPTDGALKDSVRRAVLEQLTFGSSMSSTGELSTETPVLLAWGSEPVVDVRISGEQPRRAGNVLYWIPLTMTVRGPATFDADLMHSTVIDSDRGIFTKQATSMTMSLGSATLAFRPVPFDGTLSTKRVAISVTFGGEAPEVPVGPLVPAEPQPCREDDEASTDCPPPTEPQCDPPVEGCFAAMEPPQIELWDRTGTGTWVRMDAIDADKAYDVANPERYVDPGTGTILVRFVNETMEGLSFNFRVRVEGDVR